MRIKIKNNSGKGVPDDIRKGFGKFYIFSIVLFIFMVLFPFIFKYIKLWFSILLVIIYLVLFVYMIVDLYKKKKRYWTFLSTIFIMIFIFIETLDILKIVFFLIK